MNCLRTSDLARAAGVHPNTVRRYAEWGLLPPVGRAPNGYRCFTQRHLDCLRLACLVYRHRYPGKLIHQSEIRILQAAVEGDLADALSLAHSHLGLVQAERDLAEQAAGLLERWAAGERSEPLAQPLTIGMAADRLGVTIDVLRNWDRNGLIDVPRDSSNGYRRYGAVEMSRLRIIRMLSRAGYSLAAILRMLLLLDSGETDDLRHALDTPRPDEDVYMAADRWLSTLAEEENLAGSIVGLIEEILQRAPEDENGSLPASRAGR